MLFNLICFLFISAFLFITLNHPLAIGIVLLIQTVLTALITGLIIPTYWFSYILFLVFLGGMLVLFIYVTSLASNEIFRISLTNSLIIILSVILPLTLITWDYFVTNYTLRTLSIADTRSLYLSSTLEKIYSYPTAIFTLTLILYLLLTLVIIVNITRIHAGPLRPLN